MKSNKHKKFSTYISYVDSLDYKKDYDFSEHKNQHAKISPCSAPGIILSDCWFNDWNLNIIMWLKLYNDKHMQKKDALYLTA